LPNLYLHYLLDAPRNVQIPAKAQDGNKTRTHPQHIKLNKPAFAPTKLSQSKLSLQMAELNPLRPRFDKLRKAKDKRPLRLQSRTDTKIKQRAPSSRPRFSKSMSEQETSRLASRTLATPKLRRPMTVYQPSSLPNSGIATLSAEITVHGVPK